MSLVAETSALFQEILNRGLILRVKATGRSMSPFLAGGEILTIRKVPGAHLYPGDLIFFKTVNGSLLLHRIMKKKFNSSSYVLQTKGDALIALDEPVTEHDIFGKACRIEKKSAAGQIKHVDMESLYWRTINYLRALTGLVKSDTYFALAKSPLYTSFRSIIKSLHS